MLISSRSINTLAERMQSGEETFCSGLFLSARWFAVSQLDHDGIQMIVLPDKDSAEYCAADLYNLIEGDRVFFLPDSGKNLERSNYKSTLGVQRTSAIGRIIDHKEGKLIIVTYPSALEEGIPDTGMIRDSLLKLTVGDEISHEEIVEAMFSSGFERVDFVAEPGQFAIRGAIVDIFSYSYSDPFRISFFGDEIDSINIFDCNTQLSKEKVMQAEIYPDLTSSSDEESMTGIPSVLPEDTLLWLDSSDMYKGKDFFPSLLKFRRIYMELPLSRQDEDAVKFSISPQPTFNKNFELLTEDIRKRLEEGYRVRIYGEKQSQLERLRSILSQNGGLLPEFVAGCNIHNGFIDHENKVCCYSDHEIFDRFHRVSIRRTVEKSEQLTINDLTSFAIGDYIVHIDYGVGIFGGLVRMRDDKGRMHEVVKLTYKDNDVVFVSVHALHKISRYKSKDSEPPKIHKLGSKAWQNLKTSTKSKVKDIAKDLIKLYAQRKSVKGFAFSADTYLQQELESSFMYEDTPDQEKAVYAVRRDMEDSCPMDRLVCGDVGFGKTEVAVRAAFKAVADSKQVAVLVPTTILALQHFKTFQSRLKDLPCNIDYVSRLRTAKEISDIQKRLKAGTLDIVIGTHKLIGKGFEFKDLGLLIIDEEQKFGVGAKEKLRQLKTSVDTLTLTATPIPRTLQFSLLGARDLSIISTPPPNRIPVQTEIMLFDHDEMRKIINYELNRGGQVFFVHNRVEELQAIHDILKRLVPDMKICVAHGQMEAKVLENKILDFMAGDYDMLLCTTIIENGLDIPNANTIIINQAQNIGLSDLHQLRGRVGRSNKRAFCYLIVPPLVSITEDARRRLKAIESFSDLGSGFNIAMQDLDIRGAGNLLGAEQSGFIADLGYETYQKILSEAVKELRNEEFQDLYAEEANKAASEAQATDFVDECQLETDLPAHLPETYVPTSSERMLLYRELDQMEQDHQIEAFCTRLKDRFGPMPKEAEDLCNLVRLRRLGKQLGAERLVLKNGQMRLYFVQSEQSPYYQGHAFGQIVAYFTVNAANCQLSERNGHKFLNIARVGNVLTALSILENISTITL